MAQRKRCHPKDMIMFLLAFCCREDSSQTAVSRDDDLNKRFEDCYERIIPIANDVILKEKLNN
jgi:hypothetical protein